MKQIDEAIKSVDDSNTSTRIAHALALQQAALILPVLQSNIMSLNDRNLGWSAIDTSCGGAEEESDSFLK